MQYLPQTLPDFDLGDAPDPFRAIQRVRHYIPQLRPVTSEPLTAKEREALLDRHCSAAGKKHDFSVLTRKGTVCLWCGMVERAK